MTLWLCLRFPRLALQCQNRGEELPLALVDRQRLLQVNDCAAALGLAPGMGIATARALAGDTLQLLSRDTSREAAHLEELCCWAYSFTPNLHPWREDCLQLEIGGCLRLFGGMDALLAAVEHDLRCRELETRRGLASTAKAAWLLSHGDEALATAEELPLVERLGPLPLATLYPLAQALAELTGTGLNTLGELLALPESALGRRCGRDTLHLLQQITGRIHDRQADFHPPRRFRTRHEFGYEVTGSEEMLPAIVALINALCGFLRNTQQQTSTLRWCFVGASRQQQTLTVRSSEGLTDPRRWLELTRARMERYPLRQGAETLILACKELTQATQASGDLFSSSNSEPLATLRDRLRNRLGLQAIRHLGCRAEHLPELATATGTEPLADSGASACAALRPFWLMPEPQPLQSDHDGTLYWQGRLSLLHGPERIEDNWWDCPASRDYFVAEGGDGMRYWIFQDRRQRTWYLHGVFT